MRIGVAGDCWSLARVFGAMAFGAVVLGAAGYLFDLAIGPLIGMDGWWTVFFHGGAIIGAMLQAVREFATPSAAEREQLAREQLAREARARAAAEPAPEPAASASLDSPAATRVAKDGDARQP